MKISRKINYSDKQLTGSQRLVLLYRYASTGQPFSATQFAEDNHIKYHLVYHYIKLLKRMGFNIENTAYGEWQMIGHDEAGEIRYTEKVIDTNGIETEVKIKYTRAQNLVNLYRELIRGTLISPTTYARKVGVSRQTIYHQLDLLSQSGIPVINTKDGWTLTNFIYVENEND